MPLKLVEKAGNATGALTHPVTPSDALVMAWTDASEALQALHPTKGNPGLVNHHHALVAAVTHLLQLCNERVAA